MKQGEECVHNVTVLFEGIKRRTVKEKEAGDGKIQTDQVSISFALCWNLIDYILYEDSSESDIAHIFLTIT